MDLGLDGHAAIVAGDSSCLGLGSAEALVPEVMQVLAAALSKDELQALAERSSDSAAIPLVCDVAVRDKVECLSVRSLGSSGRLDAIVNSAGIALAARFKEETVDIRDETLAVNLLAPVMLAKAAGTVFLQQGHVKVTNIASTSGLRGKPTLAAYSASKGALLRFTEVLASERTPHNIQVNAIAPGAFEPNAQRVVLETPEILTRRLRRIPAGRMGKASEIGRVSCCISSPISNFVTGSIYVIDGGESSRL